MPLQPQSKNFLQQYGWSDARCNPFPADWSVKTYARLHRDTPPYRAIFMQTAPDAAFHDFIHIARLLKEHDCPAPELYALDTAHGLMLLEDFGNDSLGRLFESGADQLPLFYQAVDTLCYVQRRTLSLGTTQPDLPLFDGGRFITLLQPVLEQFSYADAPKAQHEWQEVWQAALLPIMQQPQALLLRDFMPDNLMLIAAKPNGQTIGLLDFELAGIGCIAYDLISLTEQIRRPLAAEIRHAVHDYYLSQWPELDQESFRHSMAVLSVQRHARIWARLRTMSRPDFYAQTFHFLRHELQHPACSDIRAWFYKYLPQYFENMP